MNGNASGSKKRMYLIGLLVLLISLGSSITIYLTADDDPGDGQGYEIVGGTIYSTSPQYNKKYVHDLQLYGGSANVLADRFNRWFIGLWQGKTLAYTIFSLGGFIALVFFFVGYTADHHDVDSEKT